MANPARITVACASAGKSRGMLLMGGMAAPCALGRAGIAERKREGDGATPAGRLALISALYRPDRLRRPASLLPAFPLAPDSAWCDDPADRRYNRAVRLPYGGRCERLWRDDGLYDVIVILDYNLARPKPGAGSAIFLHVAAPDFSPTEGCVAVSLETMRRILARARSGTILAIAS